MPRMPRGHTARPIPYVLPHVLCLVLPHGLCVRLLHRYFNSAWYRVPYYNLLHPFITVENDTMLWSQIDVFLQNAGIVLALILSLVRA